MTPPSIRYQLYPELISGDNCHETATGYLITKYGTYDPNMCFIINDSGLSDKVNWRTFSEDSPFASLKFDASTILFIPGEYWMGKNSMRHCFEPREDGDYILIAAYWGGRCDVTKGSEFSELKEKAIYAHRSKSKTKGRKGVNFYVFEKDWTEGGEKVHE